MDIDDQVNTYVGTLVSELVSPSYFREDEYNLSPEKKWYLDALEKAAFSKNLKDFYSFVDGHADIISHNFYGEFLSLPDSFMDEVKEDVKKRLIEEMLISLD